MFTPQREKDWLIKSVDDNDVAALKKDLPETNEKLCTLFTVRGIRTYDQVRDFFNPDLKNLLPPFLLADMDKAVGRILSAIRNDESILIFGDYDVDGTASTAMLLQFLRDIYRPEKIYYHIPDRYKEGYGLSRAGIEYAEKSSVTLIITLDCGISSYELIREYSSTGIDFIICDHHLPGAQIPPAEAIINPKLPGRHYPFKELCGCGLTFKLIQSICIKLQLEEQHFLKYLDLVALATGADVVPLVNENRILGFWGLKKLNENPCAGIKALKEATPDVKQYSLRQVVFGIAPRINAAGRLDHGNIAVELLSTDDEMRARTLARELTDLNERRKTYDGNITAEAISILENEKETRAGRATVVFNENWHQGVIGIVAARLVETYYRPTIVFTRDRQKKIAGSARSIPGFDIFKAIQSCSSYLDRFGGHPAAAGLTLRSDSFDEFKFKFEEVVSKSINPSLLIPKLHIDLEITLEDINYRFFNTLSRMEPFGQGNPKPVFITRNLKPIAIRLVGENHLKMSLKARENKIIEAIGFNMKSKLPSIKTPALVDIVYTISENEWNNHKSLQIKLVDLRNSFL